MFPFNNFLLFLLKAGNIQKINEMTLGAGMGGRQLGKP